MNKVRFGIVGVGNMGSAHLRYIANHEISGAEVTAVCDINGRRLKMAEELYPSIKLYSEMDAMLDSGLVDAVLIATPHYDHPPLAIKALEKAYLK